MLIEGTRVSTHSIKLISLILYMKLNVFRFFLIHSVFSFLQAIFLILTVWTKISTHLINVQQIGVINFKYVHFCLRTHETLITTTVSTHRITKLHYDTLSSKNWNLKTSFGNPMCHNKKRPLFCFSQSYVYKFWP